MNTKKRPYEDIAEELVCESEDKLASLVRNLPGAAYRCLYDAERTMIFISDGCRSLTGYSPDDFLMDHKITYSQIIHPNDRQYVFDEIGASLKKRSPYQLLYRIMTADNQEKWVCEQGVGIYNGDENLVVLEGFITDISEKVKANIALQSYETRFQSIWEGSFDGMRLTDKDGKIIAVNKAFCRQVGMRRNELENASIGIIYPPEERQEIETNYRNNFSRRHIKSLTECESILWNGQKVWFEISNSFLDIPGEQVYLLSIFRDITKRKNAEAELAESARRFRWLYEYAPIAYHTITPDGVIVDVNRQWCEIMGYSKEEVCGRPIFDFVIESERESARKSFAEKKLSKKTSSTGNERHYLTKSGEVKTFSISDYIIRDDDGRIRSIQTTMSDISELKRTEEALRMSEAKFRHLVESSLDVIWQADDSGRVLYVSPNIKDILGRTPDKLIGKQFADILPKGSEEKGGKIIASHFTKRKPIKNLELTIVNHLGQEIILEVNGVPNYDGGKKFTGYIGTMRNVTIQKIVEDEQIKVQKLESLSILAGGIAHDFNNMLSGILGNISLAKMKVKDSDITRILERSEKAALRSRSLTQQLLTFAKGGAPVMESIQVESFLRELVEFATVGSSVNCQFDIAPNLPNVEADRGQLSQVIQNLVINAIQAMPSGGNLKISANAEEIKTDGLVPIKSGYYLKIAIQDTGVGIPKNLLSKVFDPYFTTKPHGNGLGLSVVYSILKKHDAYIFVDSEAGNGTTFTIYLPATAGVQKGSQKAESQILKGHGRILVMDDDELICEVVEEMISSMGYDVKCVPNGEEAIKSYKEAKEAGQPFDLVIMDLTIVGGMGGKETIAELKKFDPDVKALVSSGYINDSMMTVPQKYGFIDIIAKPYRMEDLSSILKEHVG